MAPGPSPAAGTASTYRSPTWPARSTDSAPPAAGSATTSSPDLAARRSCWRIPPATWSNCSSPPGEAPSAGLGPRAGHHPRRADRQEPWRSLTMPTPDPDPERARADPRRPPRPLGEVLAVMLKLGTIAFGGPAVHVAMLREETVRRRRWLQDAEFLDLFGAVSILPGPSSTQLAIVLARRRAGWAGLLLGGACFIAPAMAIVLALAWAYVRYGSTPTGAGVLYGVGPVVIAVVAVAVWELAHSALTRHREQGWLASVGLAAVGVAALAGYLAGLNALGLLAAAGLAVSLAGNWRRLRPSIRSHLLPVLPVGLLAAAVPARRHPGL